MKQPFQMYSKIRELKIIQLKSAKTFSGPISPLPFVGVINHKITAGLIVSSKLNKFRKDGMSLKYFRNNFVPKISEKDLEGNPRNKVKVQQLPLPIEFKSSGLQLIAKKYIKSFLQVPFAISV